MRWLSCLLPQLQLLGKALETNKAFIYVSSMASIDDDYQETVVSDVHEASLNPISRFSIFEPKEVDECSEQHRKENIVSVDSEGDLTLPRRRRIPCKAFLETFYVLISM